MERFIKLADIRKLNKQVSLGEISSSRMIEIINEKANEYAKMHVENFKTEQAKKLLEIFGEQKVIAYEWHNEETGHAIVDYDTVYREDLEKNGYEKHPLVYKQHKKCFKVATVCL